MPRRSLYATLYDLDADEPAWTRQVTDALGPSWPRGRGQLGWSYRLEGDVPCTLAEHSRGGLPEGALEHILRAWEHSDGVPMRALFDRLVVDTLSEHLGRNNVAPVGPVLDGLHPIALDTAGICAGNAAGDGFLFVSMLDERTTLSAPRRRKWRAIACHLAAARRLRRRLTTNAPAELLQQASWVWRDDGHSERSDARSPTPRERLDAAVRSRLREGDGVHQVAALPALVAGRWSIVHVGDTDGRRYVVALDNPPDAQQLAGLSERQAQVLRLTLDGHGPTFIAYELGLSQSTISHHRARLREHFGVTHDVALLEVVGALLAGQRAQLDEAAHIAWLPAPASDALTPVERSLVVGVRSGQTDEQLAARRGVSVKTVRNQLHRLFQKVGVHSRLELVSSLMSPLMGCGGADGIH